MADEEIYTIEPGIAEIQTRDAYLNSYRPTEGPPDAITMQTLSLPRPKGMRALPTPPGSTMTSEDNFRNYRHSNNRILAIIAALVCFFPIGIVALVFTCRAKFANDEGKYAKAEALGKSAREMAVASIILGTSVALFGLLILIIAFLPGVRS